MERCVQRNKIIEIIKTTENWDMLDEIEKITKEDQVYITDHITNMFRKWFPITACEYNDFYHEPVVIDAFEEEIRKIYLEMNRNSRCLKPISGKTHIDHFSELCVVNKKHWCELDLWIRERRYCFDPCLLAIIIFDIWCGKVTFEEPK